LEFKAFQDIETQLFAADGLAEVQNNSNKSS
jgi:hypothetical protein